MGMLVAQEFSSLDGVAQAPSYPDKDTSGGFAHGGWNTRFMDDESMQWVIGNITEAGSYLLGRRTYEAFAAHWPNASEQEQVVARPLNERPKYVASTTLTAPLAWQNSTLLDGDLVTAVAKLTADDDVHVIGSTQLVRFLTVHGLIDEYRLMLDPILLGGGKRYFPDDGTVMPLRLLESRVTATGALLATYTTARD
jgi:dihydrofolate reductase